MATPAPVYTPNLDPGLAVYGPEGGAHLIHWQTFIVGLQYTIPALDGKLWVSGNYSRSSSNNAHLYGTPGKVRSAEDFADICVFGDITPAVRLGAEYAYFNDHYAGDGVKVTPVDVINNRFQFSAFYIF
jgi:hypothetical protein